MLTKNIKNPIVRNILEWLFAIATAFILFLIIRNFIFRVADVNGHSMQPTLEHGDFVLLSKIRYWFDAPQHGDIIAFPFRGNPSEYYIKRVIGVPGDTIDFLDNQFIVNGQTEEYSFAVVDIFSGGDTDFPITVAAGEFFVLGDNRNASKDSRYTEVGLVPQNEMLGRVTFRLWPIGRIGLVSP
ncbi:MAG: signal peptidase I [Firmicutes bacterium]|nr:signal peptidase I [Bacillota bacterium]